MVTRFMLALIVIAGALSVAGSAMGQDKVHSYLNETALQVKSVDDPVVRRAILTKDLARMTETLAMAEESALTSADDDASLAQLRVMLQYKSDELAGSNGFERVPDHMLNAFATYVVQDMEQAERKVNISLVTALLIIIIVILIASERGRRYPAPPATNHASPAWKKLPRSVARYALSRKQSMRGAGGAPRFLQ